MPSTLTDQNGIQYRSPITGAATQFIQDNFSLLGNRARKANFLATTAPSSADNESGGYRAGSLWLNTLTGLMYQCVASDNVAAAWRTYSVVGHAHAIADVTGLQATLDGINDALDEKAGVTHTHAIADVTGLLSVLNNKVDVEDLATSVTTGTLSAGVVKVAGDIAYLKFTDDSDIPQWIIYGNGTLLSFNEVVYVYQNGTVEAAAFRGNGAELTGLTVAQVDGAAPLDSPPLSGNPTAPTQSTGNDSTRLATTQFVQARIAEVINTAPANLDTLGEIATQLASDESALSALVTTVSGKVAKSSNLSDLTDAGAARGNLGLGSAATLDSSAFALTSHSHSQTDITNLTSDLASKASASDLASHTGNTSNPHSVTATQVGAYTTAATDTLLATKAPLANTPLALTDQASVAWNTATSPVASLTIGGNRTLAAPTNLTAGSTYLLAITQDGTGSRTLAYNSIFKWAGGAAPTLSTAAGAKDLLTLFSPDGTNLWGTLNKGFA